MSKVYRNDHDNDICNQSENRPFASVLEANISRRTLLKRWPCCRDYHLSGWK